MTNASGFRTRLLAGLRAPAGGDTPPQDPYDFSVVLGGPLYQLVRRAHLSGDALELLRRRVTVISLFAWLPLLVLSALGGRAWGTAAISTATTRRPRRRPTRKATSRAGRVASSPHKST